MATNAANKNVAIIELKNGQTRTVNYKTARGSNGFINLTYVDDDGEELVAIFDLKNDIQQMTLQAL